MNTYTLYLANEAYEWENATPVGCGRLGAMLYGGVERECLQLNEERIWSGESMEICADGFAEKIVAVRDKLRRGENADDLAHELLDPYFRRIKSYETAGELYFDMQYPCDCDVSEYRRELNLNDGIAKVTYKKGGVGFTRTLFASYPKQIIAMRIEADRPASVSFTAGYGRHDLHGSSPMADSTEKNGITDIFAENGTMTVCGETVYGGHKFSVKIGFVPAGGEMTADECGNITVKQADRVDVYIAIATDSDAVLPEISAFDEFLAEHIADFSSVMNRADIAYDYDKSLDSLPVPERLKRIADGECDTGLVNLYFQFGRYLLLSSSRGSSLPTNLQGVWSGYINGPWNVDYHTNINLQMNYWHAETANLPECTSPLFGYINDYLLPGGRRVAEEFYKCRGAVLHHVSDIYGFASPADGLWGLWPMGGAWLCYSLWEHYLFAPDAQFLGDTAYPYIEACTRFFLDYMFEDENGMLGTGPSTSPENRYYLEENGVKKEAYLCVSPTMDIEIIRGLFEMYIKTEEILGRNPDQLAEAKTVYAKLPPLKIGSRGQLMEWSQDYEEPEPGHRHISHAFALYPGWEINRNTPELMAAIAKTLELRLQSGGGHTGWSCAWLINLYARLMSGNESADMIKKLFVNSTKENLFDSHPPFQIDGNFGASAAIAEMLLQSHTDVIEIHPALPSLAEYSSGSFEGLRARGGITVSAAWAEGKVTKCSLACDKEADIKLLVGGEIVDAHITAGVVTEICF